MAVSKCVSLSNENRIASDDPGLCFRIDETGSHGTPDFPVAVYLDNVTADFVNWHWHDEIEIGFVTEGEVVVRCGTRKATLRCGDVFFINSGVLHSMCNVAPPQNAIFKSIAFSSTVVADDPDSVFWQKYVKPVLHAANLRDLVLPTGGDHHAEVLSLLSGIWDAAEQESPYYEMLIRNSLSSLFCILLQMQQQSGGDPARSTHGIRVESRVHILLDHIHAHYHERITLDELACAAAISKTEALRCFKRIIGKSPMRYLKEYRLQQAAYLLAHTARPVHQIGEDCGFEDSSYFAKSFREMYRMSPVAYRQRESAG